MNPHLQLFQINIEPQAPKSASDFWFFNFLRTYTDCSITTGAILRKEPLCFDPYTVNKLKFDKDIYFSTSQKHDHKPVAIMTNSINHNF